MVAKAHLPPPHRRPSIDLGQTKAWQDLTWGDVEAGDIVVDRGQASSVTFSPSRAGVTVVFQHSIVSIEASQPVRVFSRKRDG